MPTFELSVSSLRNLLENSDDIDAAFDQLNYDYLTTHRPQVITSTTSPRSSHNHTNSQPRLKVQYPKSGASAKTKG